MHIKKQRLLTPGPTPLYPPALHAMMASDMHHRTEDFRNVYKSVLSDLKEVLGTSNDLLIFVASGTGALDGSVSNFFSRGDKVIVCSAGKFGERFVEIAKAYGLDATVLKAEYGDAVSPERVEQALKEIPGVKGVFVQASETSTGAAHDIRRMAEAVRKTDAISVVDGITGIGTMPLDIEGWGIDILVGGSQKAFMIPPGLAFATVSAKAWKASETAAALLFRLQKGKKVGGQRRSKLDSGDFAHPRIRRSAEVRQEARHGEPGRERAVVGQSDAPRCAGAGPRAVRAGFAGLGGHLRACAEGHGLRRDRERVPQPLRSHHRERTGVDEGPDLPHRAPRQFRFL
jgi:hypothetical protein